VCGQFYKKEFKTQKLFSRKNQTVFFLALFVHNSSVPKSYSKRKMSSDRKAVIKNADMSEDMQQDAVDCASQALEKYNIEKVSCFSFHS
jgi:hypothetical protein